MNELSDANIAAAIAEAKAERRDGAALRRLEELRAALERTRPDDAVLAEVLEALTERAHSADAMDKASSSLKALAEWRERMLGAAALPTMTAWSRLGDWADEAFDWPTAVEAWRHLAAVVLPGDADDRHKEMVCKALRGLAGRALTDEPAAALALCGRELALRQSMTFVTDGTLMISYDNIASAREAVGDVKGAIAARERELSLALAHFGGDNGFTEKVRDRLTALRERAAAG